MPEYIEREAVRLAYEKSARDDKHWTEEASAVHRQEHRHMLHVLDKIPAADVVEVRHGRWIKTNNCIRPHQCSDCGYDARWPYKYCPHCGCKMDGGAE